MARTENSAAPVSTAPAKAASATRRSTASSGRFGEGPEEAEDAQIHQPDAGEQRADRGDVQRIDQRIRIEGRFQQPHDAELLDRRKKLHGTAGSGGRNAAGIDVVGFSVDDDAHGLHALFAWIARTIADGDHLVAGLGGVFGEAGADRRRGRREFDAP